VPTLPVILQIAAALTLYRTELFREYPGAVDSHQLTKLQLNIN